jgi:hypothetical protein
MWKIAIFFFFFVKSGKFIEIKYATSKNAFWDLECHSEIEMQDDPLKVL